MRETIQNEYFEWLYEFICHTKRVDRTSFKKLFRQLHDIEFTFTIPLDRNRAVDGCYLRDRFIESRNYIEYAEYLYGPCSVLEMIIALALRCEETIMDDATKGNRTSQWFWRMITNLGLGSMIDAVYDPEYVENVIGRFLNREYESDGHGGLFIISNCDQDLRDVEIWIQAMWYLNSIS